MDETEDNVVESSTSLGAPSKKNNLRNVATVTQYTADLESVEVEEKSKESKGKHVFDSNESNKTPTTDGGVEDNKKEDRTNLMTKIMMSFLKVAKGRKWMTVFPSTCRIGYE